MGKGFTDAVKEGMNQATLFRGRSAEQQVVHLTKLVHILWKELEK